MLSWWSRSVITSLNSYEYLQTGMRLFLRRCSCANRSRNAHRVYLSSLRGTSIYYWHNGESSLQLRGTAKEVETRRDPETSKSRLVNIAESSCLNVISLTRCASSFAKSPFYLASPDDVALKRRFYAAWSKERVRALSRLSCRTRGTWPFNVAELAGIRNSADRFRQ